MRLLPKRQRLRILPTKPTGIRMIRGQVKRLYGGTGRIELDGRQDHPFHFCKDIRCAGRHVGARAVRCWLEAVNPGSPDGWAPPCHEENAKAQARKSPGTIRAPVPFFSGARNECKSWS